jgi:Transposase DDE domain
MHYSDDQTDYPLLFELWRPADLVQIEQGLRAAQIKLKESKQGLKESNPDKWRQYLLGVWRRHQNQSEVAALYDRKLRIAARLCRQWISRHPEPQLPVAFDSWYTQPGFCQTLDKLGLAYVGALAGDEEVALHKELHPLSSFAAQLKIQHQEALEAGRAPIFLRSRIAFKGAQETYYTYCRTHRLAHFGKVRLVISHRRADLADNPRAFIANRLVWQAKGIVRIYRHRWPVEVYHEEGKAEGLDQYQLRDFGAVERHVALVAVVYSLLRAAQHDQALQQTRQRELEFDLEGSLPFWRRATQAHSLWNLALLISAGLTQGRNLPEIMAPLLRIVCPR